MKPAALLLLVLCAAAVYGQSELATVTGAVIDAGGAAIPAADVTIRNTDTNITHHSLTNEEGYFTLPNLPPGPYELTVGKQGFTAYRESKIVLATGQTLRND